jgi:UDPglucose 6-dehydrogenase
MKKIGFIGIGKLGLDCAEVFAEQHEVRGYDIYPRVSDTVKVCDISEVVNESEWIFIAVPTPHTEGYDGSVPSSHMTPKDFGHDAVINAINNVNKYATTPKKVVLISTVLPGTTRKKFIPLLDAKHQFVYNPYLIAMGSVKWDMVNPEMIMLGTEDGSLTGVAGELRALYDTIMQNNPRYEVGTWDECEAIKIFYNTFISAKLGLVNMIQDVAVKNGNINVDVVTTALANANIRITSGKYMTAGMGDAGPCHPRDNIALRHLSEQLDLGYDIFDTIMLARERQAENLAEFLIDLQSQHDLPIVIHGKAYKPNVDILDGSYSLLIGHYLNKNAADFSYSDPLTGDHVTDGVQAIVLLAHNQQITYSYTGRDTEQNMYFKPAQGSIIVDPWRKFHSNDESILVIHYGNTRQHR